MFIALPHSADLHLDNRAYVTWAICLLCLLVHVSGIDKETLVYYPDSWNPLMMLVAAVAHADWMHLIGNLIFFCAFSPALEIMVGSRLRYIIILISLALITHIAYSFYTLIAGDDIPTLGLSGVVMGVIGLSGYLMPKARIKVFVWFIVLMRDFYTPTWILALWYIGMDSWELLHAGNAGGINLVAHVSGGVAGFLIGYYKLRDRRDEIKDEIDDAIDYAHSQRYNSGSIASLYSGGRQQMQNAIRQRDAVRDYEAHMARIYQLVRAHRDSDAMLAILQDYELHRLSVEIYVELFDRMAQWGTSAALLCVGRLCIQLSMAQRNYRAALEMALRCHKLAAEFVLADVAHVIPLAQRAIEMKLYRDAWMLLRDAAEHYGESALTLSCRLLEIELLWQHLDAADTARTQIKALLSTTPLEQRDSVLALARRMQ